MQGPCVGYAAAHVYLCSTLDACDLQRARVFVRCGCCARAIAGAGLEQPAQAVNEMPVYGKIIHVQRSISSACCSVGLDSCRSACPLRRDANTVMLRALHGVLPTVRAESGAAARAFFARFLGS
jgi:hypothetical protein